MSAGCYALGARACNEWARKLAHVSRELTRPCIPTTHLHHRTVLLYVVPTTTVEGRQPRGRRQHYTLQGAL